jgi:hypothetical protein
MILRTLWGSIQGWGFAHKSKISSYVVVALQFCMLQISHCWPGNHTQSRSVELKPLAGMGCKADILYVQLRHLRLVEHWQVK